MCALPKETLRCRTCLSVQSASLRSCVFKNLHVTRLSGAPLVDIAALQAPCKHPVGAGSPCTCAKLVPGLAPPRGGGGSSRRVGILGAALVQICVPNWHIWPPCWLDLATLLLVGLSASPYRTLVVGRTIGKQRADGQGGGAQGHSFGVQVGVIWHNKHPVNSHHVGSRQLTRQFLFTTKIGFCNILAPITQPSQLYRFGWPTRYVWYIFQLIRP